MAEAERLVSFSLLGQEYRLYTETSEEEMAAVLSLVKELLEKNSGGRKSGALPASRVAVLTCLNIASDYLRIKGEFDLYKKKTEGIIGRINEEIGGDL
ncbi:MAG: cell division protein ZapA [Deltaproteobacteria bacterium]|nr:MAG: cell division protein ZapA [Deltaproteobacteria bacterium]